MGTLFVVATPIGNLEDFTFRALRILQEADLILCEDTRVTQRLLARYTIEKPLLSYHQHSKENRMQEILDLLCKGKNLALVTDAGTPGISDPGNELVDFLFREATDLKIVPIPGPSAVVTLASVAGIPMDKFTFMGYPPHKKGRKAFFEKVASSPVPVIFYESPYRVVKALEELSILDSTIIVVVGRELTKKFESIYRGQVGEVLAVLKKEKQRGEFVVLTYKKASGKE